MRDRNLTGPWAGFSFKGGRLVTPEGRELLPEDLAWLSLTACIAQEWRAMMAEARSAATAAKSTSKPLRPKASSVVQMRDYVRGHREKRSSMVDPDPGAGASRVAQTRPGPIPGVRG